MGNQVDLHALFSAMSPTERIPIVIQPCLRSRVGLWEKYYYALFDITHYFSPNVGFTNIVVRSTRQVGVDGANFMTSHAHTGLISKTRL